MANRRAMNADLVGSACKPKNGDQIVIFTQTHGGIENLQSAGLKPVAKRTDNAVDAARARRKRPPDALAECIWQFRPRENLQSGRSFHVPNAARTLRRVTLNFLGSLIR